jgi:hypothetical protein
MVTQGERQPAMEARVNLALQEMHAEVDRAREAIASEMAARGDLHSAATVRRFVDALLASAQVTLDRLVEAHLAAGRADVEEITAAITKELEPSITAYLKPQFHYPDPQDAAAMRRAWASQQAAAVPLIDSIPGLVRDALASRRAADPRRPEGWVRWARAHPVIAAVALVYGVGSALVGQGPIVRTVWSWLVRLARAVGL